MSIRDRALPVFFWDIFERRFDAGRLFIDDLNAYEKLRWDPKSKQTCVEFWLSKTQELPLLSSIALDVMAVPGTEVSVERLFSHLKIVFTDKRSRMDPTLLESILLLRLNKKFN
jgi:hAT family C-terminal dimerisation region